MSIQFERITKRYHNASVVNDLTLEIATGEFFVLLGPSGSGKSTLLRAVAGLTSIDEGRIHLHGRDVTHLPPRERGVGFVFQHYALFQNMTVADNIEFALRVRRMRAAERRRRRKELLKLVALEGYDDRLPSQLSGGQQQRVAVARALAHEPAVLLLDEPFGALDAKIRVELRRALREVQQRLGTTTILVTHDQEEAFALGDRIGVMHMGRLLETGRPEQLYRQPATRFVASFLGAANFVLGELTPDGLRIGAATLPHEGAEGASREGREVVAVIRPEELELAERKELLESEWIGDAVVREVSFSGATERVVVQLARDTGVRSAATDERQANERPVMEITRHAGERLGLRLAPGQNVSLGVRRAHVLPTPISSFVVAARSADSRTALLEAPLMQQLTRSMRARVTVLEGDFAANTEPPRVHHAGVVVVASGPGAIADVARLAAAGARRILCIPAAAGLPERVLVHCLSDAARSSTLGLLASVMRHLHVEATLVCLQARGASRAERAAAFRRMLDTRAALQAAHGLDVRTDVHIGELSGFTRELDTRGECALVVVGSDASPSELQNLLAEHFSVLFTADSRCPVLVAVEDRQRPAHTSHEQEPRTSVWSST
ncbi:MAG: ATP-binding cassette domain-containing protein [Pseudomonadota bacterium]|jgi:ABC-type spermidine/putrescine transport systems, ATPase components|nr:MAG: hypothetical protein DIU56_05440 [Pseudomonadota bacterium]